MRANRANPEDGAGHRTVSSRVRRVGEPNLHPTRSGLSNGIVLSGYGVVSSGGWRNRFAQWWDGHYSYLAVGVSAGLGLLGAIAIVVKCLTGGG